MKEHLVFLILLVGLVIGTSPIVSGQGVNVRITPVPAWPDDGDFSRFAPDQYVFVDFRNREWVAYYPEDMNRPQTSRRVQLRFGNQSEVRAEVSAHVERLATGFYSYSYTMQDTPRSRSPIHEWSLIVPEKDTILRGAHPVWGVGRKGTTEVRLMNPGPMGPNRYVEMEWVAPNTNARIARGNASDPFSVTSAYAPGFTMYFVRGWTSWQYDPAIAASLPKPVADQLAKVMMPAFNGQHQAVIGPWFPPGTSLVLVAANFAYGIARLTHFHLLSHDSAFVTGALATFESYIESGAETFMDPNRMDFLNQAAPGLEAEIANAIRLALGQ